MPGAGSNRHAPGASPTVLARRRTVAAAAVAACLVADVIGVAAAANRDDGSARSDFTSMAAAAFSAGTAATAGRASTRGVGSDSAAGAAETLPAPGPAATSTPGRVTPSTPNVVERGSGTFTVVAVPAGAVKQTPTTGRKVTYTVEMEGGLGVDASGYAATVVADLTDARGWQNVDKVRFVNVSPAQASTGTKPDLRITLASPDTTDRLCAPLKTRGQVSCHNGVRVVLNDRRWLLGADAYGKDVASYRIYLVNHEMGHGIGHGHVKCAGKGKPAQVMMQQTYGLDGCTAWPWPSSKPA